MTTCFGFGVRSTCDVGKFAELKPDSRGTSGGTPSRYGAINNRRLIGNNFLTREGRPRKTGIRYDLCRPLYRAAPEKGRRIRARSARPAQETQKTMSMEGLFAVDRRPIECRSDVDEMSIPCRSNVDGMSIQCRSDVEASEREYRGNPGFSSMSRATFLGRPSLHAWHGKNIALGDFETSDHFSRRE